MAKYPKQKNVVVDVGIVNLACCDCGLVHKLGFTVDGEGILRLDWMRDNRATAQLRRGGFPYLKNPRVSDKWEMVRRRRI